MRAHLWCWAGGSPTTLSGGRTGRPDILVKVDGGYLPADVKNHLTLKPSKVKSADHIGPRDAP